MKHLLPTTRLVSGPANRFRLLLVGLVEFFFLMQQTSVADDTYLNVTAAIGLRQEGFTAIFGLFRCRLDEPEENSGGVSHPR